MASLPTIDERDTTDTMPLPHRGRTRRVVALYAFLALLAIIIGGALGVQHHATTMKSIVAPTEQSVVATAQPGVPTPTPLATRPPSPTPVPPTEPPPTTLPPTAPPAPPPPVVAAPVRSAPVQPAPAVTTNQNGQHGNGNGDGNGKGKGRGKGD